MTEKQISHKKMSKQSLSNAAGEKDSLLAQAKGIWPLIISVFAIVIYLIVSTILLIVSYKFGRL
jgi:hypothetical protein